MCGGVAPPPTAMMMVSSAKVALRRMVAERLLCSASWCSWNDEAELTNGEGEKGQDIDG